jgi:nucleoside phosphorylase
MDALLIETGMGGAGIGGAVRLALRLGFSDLLLSVGFAGALCEELGVGSVVLGNELLVFPSGSPRGPEECARLTLADSKRVEAFRRGVGISGVRVATLEGRRTKAELHPFFLDAPTIIDMESAFVASEAFNAGIPFLCLRSVSDALEDEIDFDPAEISDAFGKVALGKVLKAIGGRPGLLRSFFALWRQSEAAAHRLAEVLAALFALPPAELALLAGESRLCRQNGREGTQS